MYSVLCHGGWSGVDVSYRVGIGLRILVPRRISGGSLFWFPFIVTEVNAEFKV